MQQGIYIPASIMRKFNQLPQTHPQQHTIVPAGITIGLYIEYCSWKLWKTVRDDIFTVDNGLQHHALDIATELSSKQLTTANQLLKEMGLITLEFGAVTNVKIFRPR